MIDTITNIIQEKNILSHTNEGITICAVGNQNEGISLAKAFLTTVVDPKTMVYLSGGKTPRGLYEQFAREETFMAGAVGMVDERYGEKFHATSNETMFRDAGLIRYLEIRDIPFYPILGVDKTREETADAYDTAIRSLNLVFQKSIAFLGIGADGHTAGIAGNRADFTNPLFDFSQKSLLVSEFNDPAGMFKERVTMTFLALEMMDLLIVLVLGDDKKEALEKMFEKGSIEEIPARFYTNPEIAEKTVIITDQNV